MPPGARGSRRDPGRSGSPSCGPALGTAGRTGRAAPCRCRGRRYRGRKSLAGPCRPRSPCGLCGRALPGGGARLLELVERLVGAAGLALDDLYAAFGLEIVQGVPDLALFLSEEPGPVGRRVEDALGDGGE